MSALGHKLTRQGEVAAAGADPADVSVALQLVLMLENVECRIAGNSSARDRLTQATGGRDEKLGPNKKPRRPGASG